MRVEMTINIMGNTFDFSEEEFHQKNIMRKVFKACNPSGIKIIILTFA